MIAFPSYLRTENIRSAYKTVMSIINDVFESQQNNYLFALIIIY